MHIRCSINSDQNSDFSANKCSEAIIKVNFCWSLKLIRIPTDHVRLASDSFVEICWFEFFRTSIEKNELKSIAMAQIKNWNGSNWNVLSNEAGSNPWCPSDWRQKRLLTNSKWRFTINKMELIWGTSSIGRAHVQRSQRWGTGIETRVLHSIFAYAAIV